MKKINKIFAIVLSLMMVLQSVPFTAFAESPDSTSETMQIDDDGHNLLWPVPQTAIDNDPNLLPQNPGY